MLAVYQLLKPYIHKYAWLRRFLRWIIACNPWLVSFMNKPQQGTYAALATQRDKPQIFVDVTHLCETGLKTGIQRVVLSLYKEINGIVGEQFEVCMVALTAEGGYWHFKYYDEKNATRTNEVVVPKSGDIFLGIDLNALIINPVQTGLFDDWKRRGAKVVFTVHDILPITHTEWWPIGVPEGHAQWLRAILSVSNHVLSVSKTTQNEVLRWSREEGIETKQIKFDWFHLGADFDRLDTFDGDDKAESGLEKGVSSALRDKKVFLHVSTLEPRKGYADALDAFDRLWEEDKSIALIFVGKEGWHSESLVKRLLEHPLLGENLIWLKGISDKALKEVYERSDCLINPSYGEGFGLSLIEAAHNGLPIIARDIPIFREVLGDYGLFFTNDAGSSLEITVNNWLMRYGNDNRQLESAKISINSWNDAAYKVCRTIEIEC